MTDTMAAGHTKGQSVNRLMQLQSPGIQVMGTSRTPDVNGLHPNKQRNRRGLKVELLCMALLQLRHLVDFVGEVSKDVC